MAKRKIWVQAAHPQAQFYQDVELPDRTVVTEHVYAPTDPATGKQVPVPMEVTDTATVRQALNEVHPVTRKAALIVLAEKPGKGEAGASAKVGVAPAPPQPPAEEEEGGDTTAAHAEEGE